MDDEPDRTPAIAVKQVGVDEGARERVQVGVETLANAVKVTLGPRGRNVVIEKSWGAPVVTKDGVTVAREIELENKFENMGAQMVKEVAAATSAEAGDGTTTATVLAQSIYRQGAKLVAAGHDPTGLKRGIDLAVATAVASLKQQSRSIRGSLDAKYVGAASANGDTEIGALVVDALRKAGNGGVVVVEEARTLTSELDMVEGMQLDRGYLSAYFVTDSDRMECVLDDAYLLLHHKKISTLKQLLPVLEQVARAGKPLLIVAEDLDGEALATLVVNKLRGTLHVCAVKAPRFGNHRDEILKDLAVLTGGRTVTENDGLQLENLRLEDLGRARRITIDKDNTIVVGGAGAKVNIAARVETLRTQIEKSTADHDREALQARIAKLVGGVTRIRVGATTEVEMKEKKARVEGALHATYAAVEEGVVPGGGVALVRAQSSLDGIQLSKVQALGVSIVRRALEEPLRQIATNAGVDSSTVVDAVKQAQGAFGFNAVTLQYGDMVEAGVLDPTKVVRTALQNAGSVASLLLTSEAVVVKARYDPVPVRSTLMTGRIDALEALEVSADPRGLESIDADPPATARGAQDRDLCAPLGGDGGGLGGNSGVPPDHQTVTRFPDVMCPERVSRTDRFPVTVALAARPSDDSAIDGSFALRPDVVVDVTLEAPGFDILGPAYNRLSVDSAAPAVFQLRANRLGRGSVILDFQQGGNPLGTFTIPVEVIDDQVVYVAGKHRSRAINISPGAEPPDYILRISYDAVEPRALRFSLRHKDDVDHGREFKPVALNSTPEAYATQLYETFDLLRRRVDPVAQQERGAARGLTGVQLEDRLRRLGYSLWQKLIPADLKTYYEHHREALADRSVVLLTDEPALPWELLWPYGRKWQDAGPWCMTMRLARWLRRDDQGEGDDGPPTRLRLRQLATLIPTDSGLPHARVEADFLREFEARYGVRSGGIDPPVKEAVMSALETGGYDWLHAAAHGDVTRTGTTPLWLEQSEALTPDEIVGPGIEEHIRTRRPAFVLNACDLGVVGWSLTGMSGWANQLLKLGAGMFVAPLWQVTDAVAATFTKTFYEQLARRERVADAMRTARQRAREVRGDPSWMAYVLYAHPNAQVDLDPEVQEQVHVAR